MLVTYEKAYITNMRASRRTCASEPALNLLRTALSSRAAARAARPASARDSRQLTDDSPDRVDEPPAAQQLLGGGEIG